MRIINAALRKASKDRDQATHFMCASLYYTDYNDETNNFFKPFKHAILEGMKKYRLKTAVLTIIDMIRYDLVTKENMIDYYKGKYQKGPGRDEHSLNDDLEIFYEKITLGQVTCENVLTFCLPKLTEKG